LKKILLGLVFSTILFAKNEYNSNVSEDNYNRIIDQKKEIEKRELQEEYLKQLKMKQKILEIENKKIKEEKEQLGKEKKELTILKDRLEELRKKIEGEVTNKILLAFERNKPSKNAEIVTEMFKLNKEDTIKLLILQKEDTLLQIMGKMEPIDSAKILKELMNYKTTLN